MNRDCCFRYWAPVGTRGNARPMSMHTNLRFSCLMCPVVKGVGLVQTLTIPEYTRCWLSGFKSWDGVEGGANVRVGMHSWSDAQVYVSFTAWTSFDPMALFATTMALSSAFWEISLPRHQKPLTHHTILIHAPNMCLTPKITIFQTYQTSRIQVNNG